MKVGITFLFLAFVIILSAQSSLLYAQERVYDQYIRNSKVGILMVSNSNDSGSGLKTISVESEVEVNLLLLKAQIDYWGTAKFKDAVLQSAEVKVLRDGDLNQIAVTQKKRNRYQIEKDGEKKWIHEPQIRFTSMMLYIQEPVGIDRVYAEADGIFNNLIYRGSGKYELILQGSRNNFYYYENGVLVRAKLDHWIAPVTLKLKK